jgi:2-polyprenyl-3-methyl-5-hydroxy-6-metoxy-1,4-benzoquinol methylase
VFNFMMNWFRNIFLDFENKYYENFFIKNEKWNSYEPNEDELARWQVIEEFIRKIGCKTSINILDVGCGRGWLTNKLMPYGFVIGIDPVPGVIEYARKLYKNIEFHDQKPQQLLRETGGGRFDVIVCSEVLEHVYFKKRFIKTLKKLLKPDGYLILSTPRLELQKKWVETYGKPLQPIERWISTESLIELFSKAKLNVTAHKNTHIDDIYQIYLVKK